MDDGTTGSVAQRRVRVVAVVAAAGAALTTAVVVGVLGWASPDERVLSAVVYGLVVAVPMAVGAVALARRPDDRFATLLVGAGVLWSATSLASATAEVPYSLGRIAIWVVEPAAAYLLLAFPSGRLTSLSARRVTLAVAVLVAVLYLPTALVVDHYPDPGPGTACGAHCPANAFQVTSSEPAIVENLIRPGREAIFTVLTLLLAALLIRRARQAGPLMRRALIPVIAMALFRVVVVAVFQPLRHAHPDSTLVEVVGWLYALTLPLVALGFAAGLVMRQLYAATALQRLAQRLRGHASARQLGPAMAEALDDPTLRIVSWSSGRWVDETGAQTAAPGESATTAVTEVAAEGRRYAAIVHDAALAQDPKLMQAAASYALAVLENGRLVERLQGATDDLWRSRARVVAVSDEVRRGIERDLHDGAQQRLVALRIELALLSESLEGADRDTSAVLAELGHQVEETIDEVRDLARGIYPAVLSEQGLGPALRAAALASPVPTTVDVDGIGRLSPEVETTVYFACLEALQNAAKHAHGAHGVAITLSGGERLRFEVRDDGDGFDAGATVNGSGLTNLRDRLSAVDGEMAIESHPGRGTRVTGSVPVKVDP